MFTVTRTSRRSNRAHVASGTEIRDNLEGRSSVEAVLLGTVRRNRILATGRETTNGLDHRSFGDAPKVCAVTPNAVPARGVVARRCLRPVIGEREPNWWETKVVAKVTCGSPWPVAAHAPEAVCQARKRR